MSDPILGAPAVQVGELITWGGRSVIYQVTKVNGHHVEGTFHSPMPGHSSIIKTSQARAFDLSQMDRMAWVDEEGEECCTWALEEVCSKHLYRKAALLNRIRATPKGKRHTRLQSPSAKRLADAADREDDLV